MNIRKAAIKDLDSVVNIHLERFSSFFLTTLGAGFLKVFYKAFLKFPGVLLVVEDRGQIVGFAAGSRSNSGFFKKLVFNNIFGFVFQGVRILFLRPSALFRIFRNTSKANKEKVFFAELLSIATLPNKKGYGRHLLLAFESTILEQNSLKLPISLTTDYDDNEKAINFYKENDYIVHEVFESYNGRKMYRFIKY